MTSIPFCAYWFTDWQFLGTDLAAWIVVLLSLVIGLLMVVLFRYTSDQKQIRIAKDRIKAHLLAVRLFQDQLPVVLRSYVGILIGTGRYLRIAFKPLIIVIVPLVLLIAQMDRYLGLQPVRVGQAFLIKARSTSPESLDSISLNTSPGLETTAPAVHIPAGREIVWRVVAHQEGNYNLNIAAADQAISKELVVSSSLMWVSPLKLQGSFFKRMLLSGEPALSRSAVESVEILYPSRDVSFLGFKWNWIWLFFVLSLLAGFLAKSVLGIEI